MANFFGNFYGKINDGLFCIVIAKNACTLIKKLMCDYYGIKYIKDDVDSVHLTLGLNKNRYWHTLEEAKGKRFAVYRDPVLRLVSVYKLFMLKEKPRWYFECLDITKDTDFDRFLEFVVFELGKKNVLNQDEHIRRQSDYYNIEDVDYIVRIEDLNDFLKSNGMSVPDGKINNTDDVCFSITEEQKKKIMELYKDDYEILKSNKIWKR